MSRCDHKLDHTCGHDINQRAGKCMGKAHECDAELALKIALARAAELEKRFAFANGQISSCCEREAAHGEADAKRIEDLERALRDAYEFHQRVECPTMKCTCRAFDATRALLSPSPAPSTLGAPSPAPARPVAETVSETATASPAGDSSPAPEKESSTVLHGAAALNAVLEFVGLGGPVSGSAPAPEKEPAACRECMGTDSGDSQEDCPSCSGSGREGGEG